MFHRVMRCFAQVKNRESAARSRARKAQHTQQLENQVENLKAENRALRQRILELCPQQSDTVDLDGHPL